MPEGLKTYKSDIWDHGTFHENLHVKNVVNRKKSVSSGG